MTFCSHSAFGLRPFRKKKITDFCVSQKNKKKIKEYFNKTFEKTCKGVKLQAFCVKQKLNTTRYLSKTMPKFVEDLFCKHLQYFIEG